MSREVQVDLGDAGILVLKSKKRLRPAERQHAQRILEQVATAPGRQTLVLEDGWEYAVIERKKVA